MTVYRVWSDRRFQRLALDVQTDDAAMFAYELLKKTGQRKTTWITPPCYIVNPEAPRANFVLVEYPGTFAIDSTARKALRPILEDAGELLPMVIDSELFFYFNLMTITDCLDYERSEFTGPKNLSLRREAFDKAKLPSQSVFNIPQQKTSAFYVSESLVRPTRDFKKIYERHGLTGLDFEKIWTDSSENPSLKCPSS